MTEQLVGAVDQVDDHSQSPCGDASWTGGWLGGLVEGIETLLQIAEDDTIVVPSEGPVLRRADLAAQRAMYAELFVRFRDELLFKGLSPADCHNSIDRTGDLVLEEMSPENVGADAAVWEKVLRKFRGNLMPPPDRPQPSPEQKAAFFAALEHRLRATATAFPHWSSAS